MKKVNIEDKELDLLFQKVLPPEEFGEDSNVEELYNRIIDLEEKVSDYKIGLIEQLKVLKLFRTLSHDAITAINECISIVEKYVPHDKA